MAEQEAMLAQKLRDYIDTVRETAGVEAKRLQLMDLVRTVLGMSATDFHQENESYSGRLFILLANLNQS